MSYQVLARKWRPQRFDEVIGQRGVTQTLRNALTRDRIAQAYVFAGPRGVGKTTTARILARALNCAEGTSPDPCGRCDACVEIAEGRDIDVLEIDAATHTQIDTVREVIISGLAIKPVRDRYKIFIIDEVHQLSSHSFNALLKSIEEPPPHVVFMMATTELGKIPDTILSRAQVHEFRTIGTKAVADQLRRIADAEGLEVDAAALALIARSADGSMRDAQSSLDQVIAFAGERITADDAAAVLGLVGRDLLFELVEAVADENAPAIFDLAGRAVEAGHDLRVVCRELSRLTRDLLVMAIDPGRVEDPEIAQESERERLTGLASRFSREDLMRSFDLLTRAEAEVKEADEPRYAFEMALLRWAHVRKLTPLGDLIESLKKGTRPSTSSRGPASAERATGTPGRAASTLGTGQASNHPRPEPSADRRQAESLPIPAEVRAEPPSGNGAAEAGHSGAGCKDAFLAEIRRTRNFFYGTVVAQAQTIRCEEDRIVFTFGPAHRAMRAKLDQEAVWLEKIAEQAAGRRMRVVSELAATEPAQSAPAPLPAGDPEAERKASLKAKALTEPGVQAMLEVFAAEIRDVEEMD